MNNILDCGFTINSPKDTVDLPLIRPTPLKTI